LGCVCGVGGGEDSSSLSLQYKKVCKSKKNEQKLIMCGGVLLVSREGGR
jgi:hypothetical protein